MRITYSRLLAALLAAIVVVGVVSAVSPADTTPPASTTTATTEVHPPNPCPVTFHVPEFRTFAKKVFRRHKISHHTYVRMGHMRRCAVSPEAHKAMWRITRRQRHARDHRVALARAKRLRECGSFACNRRLGMWMAVRVYGRGADGCIDYIVSHEGGWGGVHQYNTAGSGAYGLPQALPGYKMASAGRDWADSAKTQIRWMLGYVRRYGGICGAYNYWVGHRSY